MKRNKAEGEREEHGCRFFAIIFPFVFTERNKRVGDTMTRGNCFDVLILFYRFFNASERQFHFTIKNIKYIATNTFRFYNVYYVHIFNSHAFKNPFQELCKLFGVKLFRNSQNRNGCRCNYSYCFMRKQSAFFFFFFIRRLSSLHKILTSAAIFSIQVLCIYYVYFEDIM
jgi:hypothetical protein